MTEEKEKKRTRKPVPRIEKVGDQFVVFGKGGTKDKYDKYKEAVSRLATLEVSE